MNDNQITPFSGEGTMRSKLVDVLLDISWRALSRRYFGKSSAWMYQKLDGTYGSKNTGFTPEEAEQLKAALCDLADRLRKAADSI